MKDKKEKAIEPGECRPHQKFSGKSFLRTVSSFLLLENVTFEECHFELCYFYGGKFSRVRFVGCTFSECGFFGVNMPGTKFIETDINAAVFSRCCIKSGEFNSVQITSSRMEDCDLSDAEFCCSMVLDTVFPRCRMTEKIVYLTPFGEDFGGATYWVKDDMIQFKSGDIYVDKPLSVFKKEIIEINENNQRADYLNAINYFEKVRSTWIMKEKEGSV